MGINVSYIISHIIQKNVISWTYKICSFNSEKWRRRVLTHIWIWAGVIEISYGWCKCSVMKQYSTRVIRCVCTALSSTVVMVVVVVVVVMCKRV
jgi:hypothetical protein